MNQESTPFIKYDNGKTRYDLVSVKALRGLAEVLTYGANKYDKDGTPNWKKCDNRDRYVSAIMRHFEAWRGGEELDQESGMSHLCHCMANLQFLIDTHQ